MPGSGRAAGAKDDQRRLLVAGDSGQTLGDVGDLAARFDARVGYLVVDDVGGDTLSRAGDVERRKFMAGSIICGVDESVSAKGAARVARALASALGVGLVFVRVVESDAPDAKVSLIAERLVRLSASAGDLDCGAGWLRRGRPSRRLPRRRRD
jgi:hypothetical protein